MRFPDAGGVSVFTAQAFGPAAGAVIGWFYFLAASVAQALVTLTGAHYAADALGAGRIATYGFAGAMLIVAVGSNLGGLRISARLQLVLAAGVATILIVTAVAALPHENAARLRPFAPHGWTATGHTAVLLFFAFFGWEAITHLTPEFRSPSDVWRATLLSVFLITVGYVGVAVAVVATGSYGHANLDRVAVTHVLTQSLGFSARVVTPIAACVITLGTANAFVAATSRLGYALGRDRAFPGLLARRRADGTPDAAIIVVGIIAATALALGFVKGWGAETFLVVPNSLTIIVYLLGMLAGVRLLSGGRRFAAVLASALCAGLVPLVGVSLAIPACVGTAALGYRWITTYSSQRQR
jgi:amino acid efflux transporter